MGQRQGAVTTTCLRSSMESFCSGPQINSVSFLVRTTRGLARLAKSLTQIQTMPHTPRNPHTSVRGSTIWPVLNLLNFAVLRIATSISAFVSHGDYFPVCRFSIFPAGERATRLLDLAGGLYSHPGRAPQTKRRMPGFFDKDPHRTGHPGPGRTGNRMGMIRGFRKGRRSIPSVIGGLVTSGRAP